jgi:hypothetical protein
MLSGYLCKQAAGKPPIKKTAVGCLPVIFNCNVKSVAYFMRETVTVTAGVGGDGSGSYTIELAPVAANQFTVMGAT